MTNNDKDEDKTFYEELREGIADIGEDFSAVNKEVRRGLKHASKVGHDAYERVEKTIGRDRMLGMMAGAGKGSGLGVFGGPIGVIKGTIVGGTAGFLLGRRVSQWWNADDEDQTDNAANDDQRSDEASAPPTEADGQPKRGKDDGPRMR